MTTTFNMNKTNIQVIIYWRGGEYVAEQACENRRMWCLSGGGRLTNRHPLHIVASVRKANSKKCNFFWISKALAYKHFFSIVFSAAHTRLARFHRQRVPYSHSLPLLLLLIFFVHLLPLSHSVHERGLYDNKNTTLSTRFMSKWWALSILLKKMKCAIAANIALHSMYVGSELLEARRL